MTVVDVADYDAYVDDALSLLRRYDLPPEYVDRASGLIITRPATSGQWFEPWRVDSRGGYQSLESSMHTMRRTVTIHLTPDGQEEAEPVAIATVADNDAYPGPGSYRVSVQVEKARFSAPERQVTTASGALRIYSRRMPTTQGLRGRRSQDIRWVSIGRDALLEQFLLDKLAALPPRVVSVAE